MEYENFVEVLFLILKGNSVFSTMVVQFTKTFLFGKYLPEKNKNVSIADRNLGIHTITILPKNSSNSGLMI